MKDSRHKHCDQQNTYSCSQISCSGHNKRDNNAESDIESEQHQCLSSEKHRSKHERMSVVTWHRLLLAIGAEASITLREA